MKANKLVFSLINALFAANTFAAKPPPKPASDVECVGCVDTTDIADEAISTEKLSTTLQDRLNQIEVEMANNRPVSVKANGQIIGRFLEVTSGTFASVLSSTGYLLMVDMATGELAEPWTVQFNELNCNGQGYVSKSGIVASANPNGFVTAAPKQGIPLAARFCRFYGILSAPTTQEPSSVNVFSRRSSDGCTNFSSTIDGYPVFPNNPTITGVQNPPYATPITLGY